MKNSNFLLIGIIGLVVFACQTTEENTKIDKAVSYIKQHIQEEVEHALIVPVEIACKSCVDQVVERLKSYRVPEGSKIVFTSTDKSTIDQFFIQNDLDSSSPDYMIDDQNYFFTNNLIMIHPILLSQDSSTGQFLSRELYPVNAVSILESYFANDECNNALVNEALPISAFGEITNIDKSPGYLLLTIQDKDTTDIVRLNIDHVRHVDKIMTGTWIEKASESLQFYIFEIENEMSADRYRFYLKCT